MKFIQNQFAGLELYATEKSKPFIFQFLFGSLFFVITGISLHVFSYLELGFTNGFHIPILTSLSILIKGLSLYPTLRGISWIATLKTKNDRETTRNLIEFYLGIAFCLAFAIMLIFYSNTIIHALKFYPSKLSTFIIDTLSLN